MTADGEHSFPRSFALHLLPGAAILLVYIAVYSVTSGFGYHAEFAINLSFLVVGIPLPLAYLYHLGRARNESWSLQGIVLYREKIPRAHYKWMVAAVILFGFYAGAASSLAQPLSDYLRETVFADLPRWFMRPYSLREVNPTRGVILLTLIMRLAIDGIAHPIVEELYFRGFLLPRLSRFGAWCPVLSALFFAMFHLWQPQNIPVVFLTVLPWMYLVWWKRNVYLSILIHCLANSLGALAALVEFSS